MGVLNHEFDKKFELARYYMDSAPISTGRNSTSERENWLKEICEAQIASEYAKGTIFQGGLPQDKAVIRVKVG
ncbi:MAG: hypothetical protein Q9159_002714 [Coniocarpon cinnabarinum]